MSWRQHFPSRFLKAAMLPKKGGKRYRITGNRKKVVTEGERPKLLLDLEGIDDDEEIPWVLNITNGDALEEHLGTDEEDEWTGAEVALFNDLTVRGPSGEKGGIRVKDASFPKPEAKRGKEVKSKEDDEPLEEEDLEDFEDED